MPDEYEIQAVMDKTGCDRETAIQVLEWARCRVGIAVRRAFQRMNAAGELCPSCGEAVAEQWKHCPYCGAELGEESPC